MATLHAKLRRLKMSYTEYLASAHWAEVKRRYRESPLPQRCLGCNATQVELHHRSYQRLGCEELVDLVPLCHACHTNVHDFLTRHGMTEKDVHAALRSIFGWSKNQTIEKFAPYRLPGRKNGFSFLPDGWSKHRYRQRLDETRRKENP